MSTNDLFLIYKINYISHFPRLLITLAYLLPDQAAPVLIPTVQEKFSEGKIANVAMQFNMYMCWLGGKSQGYGLKYVLG